MIARRKKLVQARMNQDAAKTAAELIVVVARTKNWGKVAKLNISEWPALNILRHWKNFYSSGVLFTYWQEPFYSVGRVKRLLTSVSGLFASTLRGPFNKSDMRVWAVKSVVLAAEI